MEDVQSFWILEPPISGAKKLSLAIVSVHQGEGASHEDHLKKWRIRDVWEGEAGNPGNLEKAARISLRWHPVTWKWPKPFEVMASSRRLLFPFLSMSYIPLLAAPGGIRIPAIYGCMCLWSHPVLISRKGLEFCVFDLSPLITCLCLEYAPARLQRQPSLLAI